MGNQARGTVEGEEVFSQKQQLRTDLNAVVPHGS